MSYDDVMKFKYFGVVTFCFCYCLLSPLSLYAQSPILNQTKTFVDVVRSTLGESSSSACAISILSDFAGLDSYASTSDIGSENTGAIRYFQHRLMCNESLGDLAAKFYETLGKIDSQTSAAETNAPLGNRPSLEDVAGSRRYSNLAPQSVYKTALSAASVRQVLLLK